VTAEDFWAPYVGGFISNEERLEIGITGLWNGPNPREEEAAWLELIRTDQLQCSFQYTGNCSGPSVAQKVGAEASFSYCQTHYDRKVARP
jgi:hypothetical protein